MAYKLMKRIIARDVKNGTLNRAATMDKLDAFLAADRLTHGRSIRSLWR